MRSLQSFLHELRRLGVELWNDEGYLAYDAADEAVLTPALLAELKARKTEILQLLASTEAATHSLLIPKAPRSSQLALSYAQQRLWFLEELGSGAAYTMPAALTIEGKLDIAALQQTLGEIIQRHESLRTTFALHEGVPYQVIQPPRPVALPVVDLRSLAPAQQQAEVNRLSEAETLRPFDLAQDLMLRGQLLQLAAERFVLLLTMHHIASDGWSIGVLTREFVTIYAAFSQGRESPLPELAIQYADFAVWQRSYLQGEVLARQLAWWKAQLADAPELLQLPSDRPRPAQQSFRGDAVAVQLAPGLTQQLRQVSRAQNSTLYMTLLAAFQVLLYRYTGQRDIVVGSPIANRNHQAVEGLIGFFVNTMALRTHLDANPTFGEVLAQVQATTQAAYDHQDLPFERLVEELRPERNLTYNPLVQISFALQNTPLDDYTLPDIQVTPIPAAVKSTRFDLELHLWEVEDQLRGAFIYATDLFDAATIQRLVQHFQSLLAGIAANPQTTINELPLLTAPEAQQILVEWNQTATAYPTDKSLHQLFEEQVARTPDALAVVMATDQAESRREENGQKRANGRLGAHAVGLTYRQLNERANQLAHHLRSLGVGPDVLVGIGVERSIEMVVGLLGVLKAGGAYVPLDLSYPAERLAFMLEDAAVSVLLTQAHLVGQWPTTGARVICLDQNTAELAGQCVENPTGALHVDQLAYMIYTSGSTGQPKGALIEQRNLVNYLWWATAQYLQGATCDFPLYSSFAFDLTVTSIYAPLITGGKIVVYGESETSEQPEILSVLEDNCVDVIKLTPSHLYLAQDQIVTATRLKKLIVGGEDFKTDLAHAINKVRPDIEIYNEYGPTETTVGCMIYRFDPQQDNASSVPIGEAAANTQLYILDGASNPVPSGVAGELYIGGVAVGRGYHQQAGLTAERFVPNSFGAGRLYKTGDLARYRADGVIEYLGRIDQQVKLRGFRIELGEIEAVLRQHPAVQEAVVVARRAPSAQPQLVAYVVTASVDDATQREQVAAWQRLYEEAYSQPVVPQALSLNLTGWNSSYTGQPIATAEMVEWVEHTVAELRQLRPQRVLEIGCGTGLLLARLAPTCAVYWGTDYSQQALAQVAQLCASEAQLAHVQVAQRLADDFADWAAGSFDCVILNSVAQYFPSGEYLERVLAGAVRLLSPGGALYVGDVRNLRLLAAYHAAVQSYQAEEALPLTELQNRIQHQLQAEEELLIDPAFFAALPQRWPKIGAVELRLKQGYAHNELTRFRYQVVLHIKAEHDPVASPPAYQRVDWAELGSFARLQACLERMASWPLHVANLPNARLQAELNTLEVLASQRLTTVGELRTYLAKQPVGIDPADLWALAEPFSCLVQLTWSSQLGCFDAYFIPQDPAYSNDEGVDQQQYSTTCWLPTQPASKPNGVPYTNNPLLGNLHRTLVPELCNHLQRKLPDYMVPSAFVLLDMLPLSANGKVDRKALPAPTLLRARDAASYVAPRTATEQRIAAIWSEVLNLERISIHDNFFALGGHSLLATQVVSRMKSTFHTEISLRALFENPTIEGLSERIRITETIQRMAQASSTNPILGSEKVEEEW